MKPFLLIFLTIFGTAAWIGDTLPKGSSFEAAIQQTERWEHTPSSANALALPSQSWSADKRYKLLEEALRKMYPDHEIILIHKDERNLSRTDLHTPLIYQEVLRVYLRKTKESA
jgi:hypothetical protein